MFFVFLEIHMLSIGVSSIVFIGGCHEPDQHFGYNFVQNFYFFIRSNFKRVSQILYNIKSQGKKEPTNPTSSLHITTFTKNMQTVFVIENGLHHLINARMFHINMIESRKCALCQQIEKKF